MDTTTKPLSPREQQVVDRVCDEMSRSAIARELGIAIRTVDIYIERVVLRIPPSALRAGGRLKSIRIYYGRSPMKEDVR